MVTFVFFKFLMLALFLLEPHHPGFHQKVQNVATFASMTNHWAHVLGLPEQYTSETGSGIRRWMEEGDGFGCTLVLVPRFILERWKKTNPCKPSNLAPPVVTPKHPPLYSHIRTSQLSLTSLILQNSSKSY